MDKYVLTTESTMYNNRKLYRIKALKAFSNVAIGDLGGYIEGTKNLVQFGDAWVSGNARVSDDAWVSGNVRVSGNAWVGGDAKVSGNARVSGNAWVSGNARVSDNAWVGGDVRVSGNAKVSGNAWVGGDVRVSGNAKVSGNARVSGNAWVGGDAQVSGDAHYLVVGRIGSRNSFTTFYRDKDNGITVSCGCFTGTLAEFRAKVIKTHRDNKHAKVYQAAADLAVLHIDLDDVECDW